MKQIIFSSIVLLYLSYFINNQQVLATRMKRAAPPQSAPALTDAQILAFAKPDDPRFQPQKYCISTCRPTMRPPPTIDANKLAKDLSDAISGPGTKEHKIINVLTRHGEVQRIQIAAAYKDKNLLTHLDKDLGGGFQHAIMVLLMPLPFLYAKALNQAISPPAIDYPTVVEILATINNFGIKSVNEIYKTLYKNTLEVAIAKDKPGSFQKIFVLMVQGKREESDKVDNAKVSADAKTLNGPASKPWKAKPPFNEILGTRNYAHLRAVFIEYKKIADRDIEDDVKKEFPGPEGEGLVALIRCIKSKAKFFAERINEIIRTKFMSKFDVPFIRILVSRSEIDLGDIRTEYEKIYKKTLHNALERKIGGDYRRTLTNMVLGSSTSTAAAAAAPPAAAPPPPPPPPAKGK